MKQFAWIFSIFILLTVSCKTARHIVVKEEAVTILNASENDVAYKYYVILGSFKDKTNALNFRSTLEPKGFSSPVILHSETGFYRVSVFSTDSEKEARQRISTILDLFPEYKDIWLLIKKDQLQK